MILHAKNEVSVVKRLFSFLILFCKQINRKIKPSVVKFVGNFPRNTEKSVWRLVNFANKHQIASNRRDSHYPEKCIISPLRYIFYILYSCYETVHLMIYCKPSFERYVQNLSFGSCLDKRFLVRCEKIENP